MAVLNWCIFRAVRPEILAFVSRCSVNFQPILDRVNTVVFNLHQIKRRAFCFFLGGGGQPIPF